MHHKGAFKLSRLSTSSKTRQRDWAASAASIHIWQRPRLSLTLPLLFFSVTDCHWDTDQRKLGENGRKLHGDIAHSGLCHVTQQQTPVLCCLRARKRKRRTCGSAMQIIQHPSCQVASTTDPERDQNRVPPLPAKPKENKGATQF